MVSSNGDTVSCISYHRLFSHHINVTEVNRMSFMGLELKNDIGKTQQQGLSQESLLSTQLPVNSLSIKYLINKVKEPKFKL